MMKRIVLGVLFAAGITFFNCCAPFAADAAPRTWSAAAGGFSVDAELVEFKDGKVALRKADGTVINVALDKLSEADRAFVQGGTGGVTAGAIRSRATALNEEDSLKALKAIDKETEICRTAEEAAMLYSVFISDESVDTNVRSQARAKQAEWQARADKSLIRHGKKWVTVEEIRNARTQAAFLVNQGVEMVRLNQSQIGLEKLQEASKVDPDGIQADFVIATIYAITAKNYEKACNHYDICLRRDPDNVAVLNNLALCEVRRAQFADAINHWKRAASMRYDQRMAQNIGRILDISGQRRFAVPQSALKQLSDVYASMVVANKVFGADRGKGFNYMLISMPDPNDITDPTLTAAINNDSPDDLTILGAGTGFVVADKYILTNRSSTKGGSVFYISNPNSKGNLLPATLVASYKNGDLALMKCDELAAAPIPIDIDLSYKYRVGEEVSVSSYALSDTLGVGVKAEHGVITWGPTDRFVRRMVQYNATTSGSTGGPVVNSMGNVIAVHCRGFNSRELHYASGISAFEAVIFMRDAVPNIDLKRGNQADMPWSKIDELTAASTVLVVSKGQPQDIGMAKEKGEAFLEDNSCIRCNAQKQVRCPAPGCAQGKVPRTKTESYSVNGRKVTDEVMVRVTCSVCRGDGKVRCPDCGGSGVDPSFNRGGRAPELPTGVKVRSTLAP